MRTLKNANEQVLGKHLGKRCKMALSCGCCHSRLPLPLLLLVLPLLCYTALCRSALGHCAEGHGWQGVGRRGCTSAQKEQEVGVGVLTLRPGKAGGHLGVQSLLAE